MLQSIENQKITRLRYLLLVLSIALFAASLFTLPFTIEGDNPKPWPIGLWCLLLGWLSLGDGAGIAWLANPFLILGWILLAKRHRSAFWLCLLAVSFCSLFLFIHEVLANEGGGTRRITSIGPSYYLWFGSSITTFVSTIIIRIIEQKQSFIHPHQLDSKSA
jgi:hypothetical protein